MEGIWLPSITIDRLIHLGSYLSEDENYDGEDVILGMALFSAPWIHHFQLYRTEQVRQILVSLLPSGLQDVFTLAAHVVLNEEDDISLYVGDDETMNPFPIPPSALPALGVISLVGEERIPRMVYVSIGSETIQSALINQDKEAAVLLTRSIKRLISELELELNLAVIPKACSSAIRLFIAGDRSSVGKSSVCLGIIGSLLRQGYTVDELAYIKPATQSESIQPIQVFCEHYGIDCVPVGPLVYYRGFTRAFLAGETPSSEELLEICARAVDRIARGKRIVLVDGVGFPAVGSICGTDNANVLNACSYPMDESENACYDHEQSVLPRKPMGVVLVGGSGVGAAVDAFNLNATYFESRHVPVIGAIFNKLPLEGFYSLENCKEQVTRYFDLRRRNNGSHHQVFGFVPLVCINEGTATALDRALHLIDTFEKHVDVSALINAVAQVKKAERPLPEMIQTSRALPRQERAAMAFASRKLRSRQEIERQAIELGAKKSA